MDRFLDIIRIALGHLAAGRFRAALSGLGVAVGAATFVAAMAVGEGAKREAVKDIEALGTNLLIVKLLEDPAGQGLRPEPLTAEEAAEIAGLPGVTSAVPMAIDRVWVNAGQNGCLARLEGTLPPAEIMRNLTLSEGRFLTPADDPPAPRVCVLGAKVAERLFPDGLALGRQVAINNAEFTVAGVLAPKGQMVYFDYDRHVIVPLDAALDRCGIERGLDNIAVQTAPGADTEEISKSLAGYLGLRHPAGSWEIWRQEELLRERQKMLRIFEVLLGSIALASLAVAGIGILNAMTAAVSERVREIGLRKALGARDRDILLQFLFESGAIGAVGGLLGVGGGVALAKGLVSLMGGLLPAGAGIMLSCHATPGLLALAFAFSAGTGVFFGLVPALRAARLDPTRAMRFE